MRCEGERVWEHARVDTSCIDEISILRGYEDNSGGDDSTDNLVRERRYTLAARLHVPSAGCRLFVV